MSLCVELKLMINTRSLSNQALKSAHPSLLSSQCWPWGVFIGAGQPLQHGEARDSNLAWVRPVDISLMQFYGPIQGLWLPRTWFVDCVSWSVMLMDLHIIRLWGSRRLSWPTQTGAKIGGVRSSWADFHKGVPQRFILGPLLFNISINDLFLSIDKCSLYNYADDNYISFLVPSLSEVLSKLRIDCNHATDLFTINGMKSMKSNQISSSLWFYHHHHWILSNLC